MRTVARYVSLALAVQLAAGCAQEPATPAEPRPSAEKPVERAAPQAQPERLVLAFGDSLYAGYGLAQDQSLPAVLERELRARGVSAEVVNAGVSGDTTAAGRARLAFTLDGLDRKPDLAIVGLGGNDALRGIDPTETRANLEAILSELDRRDIPVMITGMLAPRNLGRDYAERFDTIYPDLARRHGAGLDPFLLAGVIDRPDLLLSDGLHPNAAGVEVMAGRIARVAAERLREDDGG